MTSFSRGHNKGVWWPFFLRLAPGSPVAAAVLSLEPVAYQVKGEFADLRTSLGRRLGVIDVRDVYSASPPLPGQRLAGRQGEGL